MRNLIFPLFLAIIVTNHGQVKIKSPSLNAGSGDNKLKNAVATSPAQAYIEQCKTHIENLDKKLNNASWKDANFETGFKSELATFEEKLGKVKQKDPRYNTSEFETKLAQFKSKFDEGTSQVKSDKQQAKNTGTNKETVTGIKDDGISGPIHEKNIGKIVFSASEISKENPDEKLFGSEFKINAPIYARIFLQSSIFNEAQKTRSSTIFDTHVGLVYKILIDGNIANEGRVSFKNYDKQFLSKNEIKTATNLGASLNFNKDALLSEAYIDALVAYDSKLTDGKHTVKIDLYPNYQSVKPLTEKPIASGEFTLVVNRGFANPKNTNICMPKAVKSDPALEAKYKECLKKYIENNNKQAVLKNFVLLSSDWEIRRNEITDVPISKTMYGAAGLSYKDGKCRYETFSFTQNWNGSAYSSTIETSSTGQDGDIFCDCLK